MKHKKYIFLFILTIAVFSFMSQYMTRFLSDRDSQMNLFYQFLINLPGCILLGAVDYLIVNTVHKKLKRYGNTLKVIINLLLAALFGMLLVAVANYALSMVISYDYDIIRISIPLILWNSIAVLLIEIFFYHQRQADAEKRLAVMEKEVIQYRYEALKAQINPHFLFNSLNVLSSLAYKDAEKTNLFAKKLSGVYRYLLLTNNHPVVTLKEELAFLESYLFLELIRFENALFVDIIGSEPFAGRNVIPVSLQLLVENAVKHNKTTVNNPLTVRIRISDKGIEVSNNLQLRSSVDKGGLGLKNLQTQYALHDKSIAIVKTETDFTVKIPFL